MVLYYIFCTLAWNFCIKLDPHQLTVILGLLSSTAIFWKLMSGKPVATRAAAKFCVLHSGDIVPTYILTDARNSLLLLVVTHVRHSMPHGKNKTIRLIVALFS